MKIRQATIEDATEIAGIHIASRNAAYRNIIPDSILDNQSLVKEVTNWEQILQKNPENVFVASTSKNQIAGFVGIGPSRKGKNEGEIYAIYNHPDYFRSGTGSRLWEMAKSQLEDRGYSKIMVLVITENIPSRKFYEGVGFQLAEGSEEKFTWEGEELTEVRYEYTSQKV